MDDTFQMQNILDNLTEVFDKTEFTIHWADNSSYIVRHKLPGAHLCAKSIYLLVTSVELQKHADVIIVYRIGPDLKVMVYNTHKLRDDSYAFVREFKYCHPKSFLEDARSAQRSLLALPI